MFPRLCVPCVRVFVFVHVCCVCVRVRVLVCVRVDFVFCGCARVCVGGCMCEGVFRALEFCVGPLRKFSAGWFESISGGGTRPESILPDSTCSRETPPHTPIHPRQRLLRYVPSSGPPHDLVAWEAVPQPPLIFDWRRTHPSTFGAHVYASVDEGAV